jgi:hypothetical protein
VAVWEFNDRCLRRRSPFPFLHDLPVQVAVKQISDKWLLAGRHYGRDGEHWESHMHRDLSASGSDHIVQFLASDYIDADRLLRMKAEYPRTDPAVMDGLEGVKHKDCYGVL